MGKGRREEMSIIKKQNRPLGLCRKEQNSNIRACFIKFIFFFRKGELKLKLFLQSIFP